MRENVDVEYKELDKKTGRLPDSISREIVSFANTEGGELYLGISDDGTPVGIEDPDDVMTRISNVAHDTILPDVIPFLQIRTIEKNGKAVVKVTVSVGTERPYYLAKEGLKPRGVYVRRGSACVPVNEAGIRQMIIETSGKSFEESRSQEQELTFHVLQEHLAARNLEFGAAQMKTLKMIGDDGLYNNLALLLSDQCAHTIKAAVFQGAENAVFRDRKEFSGSLLKQLEEAYVFLDMYNKTKATVDGLVRTDRRDYPPEAIREALLNSIIHRDYLFSGSTIINVFDNHIEFISLGGLVSGLSMEAVLMGVSQSRNPNLAAVFYRLGLVESYGTGMRKMMRLYRGSESIPIFHTAEGAFTVEMPNQNDNSPPVVFYESRKQPSVIRNDDIEKEILALIQEKGVLTRKEVEDHLHVGSTKAYKCLKQLCEQGNLEQILCGNKTVYVPRG